MNIHVSECKYNCLHLVPKFGDVRNRHNWQLHPTFQEGYGKGRSKQSGWFMSIQRHVWKSRDNDANPRISRLVQNKRYWNLKSMSGKYGTGLHPLRQVYFFLIFLSAIYLLQYIQPHNTLRGHTLPSILLLCRVSPNCMNMSPAKKTLKKNIPNCLHPENVRQLTGSHIGLTLFMTAHFASIFPAKTVGNDIKNTI